MAETLITSPEQTDEQQVDQNGRPIVVAQEPAHVSAPLVKMPASAPPTLPVPQTVAPVQGSARLIPDVPVERPDAQAQGKLIPGTQHYDAATDKEVVTPYSYAQKLNPMAGVFAHADNIHNPIIRTMAKVASGVGTIAQGLAYGVDPELQDERRKLIAGPTDLREKNAQADALEAEAYQRRHPKPEWEKGEPIISTDDAGTQTIIGQDYYDRNDPKHVMSLSNDGKLIDGPTSAQTTPAIGESPTPTIGATPAQAAPTVATAASVAAAQTAPAPVGPKITRGRPTPKREGEEPATAAQIKDVDLAAQGLPAAQRASFAFPANYKPTQREVTERIATIDRAASALERADTKAFNEDLKKLQREDINLRRQDAADRKTQQKLDETAEIEQLTPMVASGNAELSPRFLTSDKGLRLASQVHALDPKFDMSKYPAYREARINFTSGEHAKEVAELNDAVGALAALQATAGNAGTNIIPGAHTLGVWSGTETATTLEDQVRAARTSLEKLGIHADLYPEVREGRLEQQINSASKSLRDKEENLQHVWRTAKPSPNIRDFPILTSDHDRALDILSPLEPGMVRDGYTFKGGNRGDRNNWVKVD